jgi:hypothetical protein
MLAQEIMLRGQRIVAFLTLQLVQVLRREDISDRAFHGRNGAEHTARCQIVLHTSIPHKPVSMLNHILYIPGPVRFKVSTRCNRPGSWYVRQ